MPDLALVVDSSTQSVKVEARDLATGRVVASGRGSHPPTTPPISEQQPEAWWTALVDACAQLGEAVADVRAMSVGGQQHGLVLVGDDGSALRPAKLWNDTTSSDQADELVADLGVDGWAGACGSVPVAAFTITKLAWVAAHEPELLERVAKVMLPHDFLTWKLTGAHVTDRGDASGTGWFSPVDDRYLPDLLSRAVPDGAAMVERLPRVLTAGEVAGVIAPDAAQALGLGPDVVVAAGTGDNMAAALGLGLRPGETVISLGTSGTVYSASVTPTADARGDVAGFAGADGGFLPLVCSLNATVVTDTVAIWLGTDAAGLSEIAMSAPDSADQPILVPYFDGERTPNLPDATGWITGLTGATTRAELARAAHDGVLCGLLAGRDALAREGVDVSGSVRLIGGGARSGAYRQRLADLLDAPVLVPDADELVAAGAAVQAALTLEGSRAVDVAERWGLRSAHTVEPVSSLGRQIRDRWNDRAALVESEYQTHRS